MNFQFKLSALTDSGKLFFGRTTSAICAKSHVKVIIIFLVYACLSQVQKVHSAICAMSNFVEQRVLSNLACGMIFPLLKRIECYKRPLVTRLMSDLMSQTNVYKWYRDFKKGRERVDDLQRSGRPSVLHHLNLFAKRVHFSPKTRPMLLHNHRIHLI